MKNAQKKKDVVLKAREKRSDGAIALSHLCEITYQRLRGLHLPSELGRHLATKDQ